MNTKSISNLEEMQYLKAGIAPCFIQWWSLFIF